MGAAVDSIDEAFLNEDVDDTDVGCIIAEAAILVLQNLPGVESIEVTEELDFCLSTELAWTVHRAALRSLSPPLLLLSKTITKT